MSIFTIGHSNHSLARFLELVSQASIATVIDVRSQPVSRWVPHFNRPALTAALAERGIGYVFMGRELGGRPRDPRLSKDGAPDYAAMSQSAAFQGGIEGVIERGQNERIALLCAERDPVDCHRFLLIGRALAAKGVSVEHILADGAEAQAATELRQARKRPPKTPDLF